MARVCYCEAVAMSVFPIRQSLASAGLDNRSNIRGLDGAPEFEGFLDMGDSHDLSLEGNIRSHHFRHIAHTFH